MARTGGTADQNFSVGNLANYDPGMTSVGIPTATLLATPPPAAAPAAAPSGGGGGGGGVDPNQGIIDALNAQAAASRASEAAALARAQAAEQQAREAASAFLTNVLKTYGLDGLAGSVSDLIREWGSNTDVISLKIKDTTQYKERFAGLLNLQQRGITDVQNESQYIQLESEYRKAFRETGLADFLGASGSSGEQAKIADIVSKYSLSVNEVRDRIADSQRVAANTPQEVKDAFKNYYNVDANQLVTYSLDPSRTADLVNRQANAAIAGGLAQQRGLSVGGGVAEQIAGIAGPGDINQGQLASDLVSAQSMRDATARLAAIENTDLSDDVAVQASMGLDADAQKRVGTLQSRERARFSGTSATTKGTLGRNIGA